jgi:cytochrome c-type biogenesis protein CcmH
MSGARRSAVLVALLALLITAVPAAAAPRASLTDIENDVMCVACHEPLNVAQSPQANAERKYIRSLIAQGQTKRQIEQALVAQYGPAVLGRPPAHGFNLTVYVLPPAIVALGLLILAVALPRWRRARATAERSAAAETTARPLNAADAKRLEDELASHPG